MIPYYFARDRALLGGDDGLEQLGVVQHLRSQEGIRGFASGGIGPSFEIRQNCIIRLVDLSEPLPTCFCTISQYCRFALVYVSFRNQFDPALLAIRGRSFDHAHASCDQLPSV
jgi:hypothetical protein